MPKSINILLIEDDGDDVELFTQALQDHAIPHVLTLLTTGLGIIDYAENPLQLPDLIVMDFNLPLLHGRDVLLHIKESGLKNVPLIVLTTSSAPQDKKYVYNHGGDRFITKPATLEEIAGMVEEIKSLLLARVFV